MKSRNKSGFTVLGTALHFQVDLLDHVRHAVDELAVVLPHVLHADVGYYDGAIVVVVAVLEKDPVLKVSVGLLVEAHGKQHVLIVGLVICHFGPFDSDTSGTKKHGVRGGESAGQRGVASEVGENLHWKARGHDGIQWKPCQLLKN